MKRKLVYVCLLAMVAGGMMSFSYDIPEKQETGGREDRVISFPGAEGHGRYTTGGRGGKVYHVTSLEDDGSQGTLRWALKQNGPKTIVFDVAGTIHLKSELRTGKDHLTIAGQTSPGGICLADYGFSINSNNVIIRFLRFRPGEASGKEPDGLGGCDKKDIMVDHCSVSWSVDECLSVYGMENSTVQWCISSEGLYYSVNKKGARAYGGAWGGTSSTYHHNLFAHCNSRTPLMNGARGKDPGQDIVVYMEYINNVNYNWGSQMATYGGMDESQDPEHHGWSCNFVNNYYKPGPATTARVKELKFFRQSSAREPNKAPLRAVSKWYFHGNVMEGNSQLTSDNWEGVYTDGNYPYSIDEMKASSFIIPSGKENYEQYWFDWESYTLSDQYESAEKAYQSVLADKSGAGAFPRDKVAYCKRSEERTLYLYRSRRRQ